MSFGEYARGLREAKGFSVRQVAKQLGIEPSHLSRIERNEAHASEEVLEGLAGVLEVDPHLFLATAGKVTKEFLEAVQARPEAFSALIRNSIPASTPNLFKAARTVRDGEW